jgi:hypothetical protein
MLLHHHKKRASSSVARNFKTARPIQKPNNAATGNWNEENQQP